MKNVILAILIFSSFTSCEAGYTDSLQVKKFVQDGSRIIITFCNSQSDSIWVPKFDWKNRVGKGDTLRPKYYSVIEDTLKLVLTRTEVLHPTTHTGEEYEQVNFISAYDDFYIGPDDCKTVSFHIVSLSSDFDIRHLHMIYDEVEVYVNTNRRE